MKRSTTLFCLGLACAVQLIAGGAFAQYNKMLIGDNNNGQIVQSDINGNNLDTINLNGLYQSFYKADVDPVHQRIYMAWYYGIYAMNYDGSNFDTLVYYPGGGYSDGVAVDPVNSYLYWTSTPEGIIYRSDLSGNNIDTVLSGLGYLADIHIDLVNGALFYGQWITGTKGLYRCDLNGANNGALVLGYDVEYLGLDIKNQRIYIGDGTNCRRVDYNYNAGTDTLLYSGVQPGGFFVDTTNEVLYVSDMTSNRVFQADLNGGNVQNLITGVLASPHGPLLYNSNGTVGLEQMTKANRFIMYPNPTGGEIHVQTSTAAVGNSYIITDLLGKTVMTGKLTSENTTIEATLLSDGIYVFRSGEKERQLFSVIKN